MGPIKIGPSALNIYDPREIQSIKLGALLFKNSPRQLINCLFNNQVQLVDIYNSLMPWIRVIPSDGPEREHSLLEEEQAEQPPEVGIREFLELFGAGCFCQDTYLLFNIFDNWHFTFDI